MSSKALILGLTGAACLAGAGLLRQNSAPPQEPVMQIEQVWQAPQSASPTPAATLPPRRPRPSPSPSSAPAPSPSPSASGSPGASASPSGAPSASPSASASPTPFPAASTPEELHQKAIVVDTHVETPFLISEKNVRLRSNSGQVSLDKLREGGVDVVFFSIYVNPYKYKDQPRSQAEKIIGLLRKEIEVNADLIELATSHADIQRIVAAGKIAGLMGMEGADPIGESLSNIDHFYKLGVRYLGPTWSTHTLMGDSSGPPKPRWNGLSKFGKMAVERMNQLGMLIDVSHLSDAALKDVLTLSKQPVIASHSAVDGPRNHPRNLSDDMLKLLALNGGVTGIVFYPPFLDASGKADVRRVVDHIEHAVKVGGVEHVGLGSDFDGLDLPPPTGLEDARRFPAITRELKARGYSNADVYRILGDNFMRVFAQVLKD